MQQADRMSWNSIGARAIGVASLGHAVLLRHQNRYRRCALLFVLGLLFATVSVDAQTKIRSLTGIIEGHSVGGVTTDLLGNIYVADFGEFVWKITPEGKRDVVCIGPVWCVGQRNRQSRQPLTIEFLWRLDHQN